MTYAAQLSITANTALDTAHICYRKARRDCYRIHALLTHPRTVEAAKIAVWCLYLGAVVAFTLGQTARIVVQDWADTTVESCLAAPAEEPQTIAQPEPEDLFVALPDLAPILEELAEAQLAPEPAPTPANPDQWLTDLADEAAQRPGPNQADWQAYLANMNTTNLRRHCTESGIRWKNANGPNRHMTKAQMIAAVAATMPAA
jgi:hypothetical protein